MDMRALLLGLAAILALVAQTPKALAEPDGAKAAAYDAVERNAEQIATIGDTIYYFAELGMQEFESAKFVKSVLESIGFTVETGAAGMPTNIFAHWGTGKPQIVIVSEMDALPEGSQTPGSIERMPLVDGAPGHMEGHNTHAGVAIGAAYAVKQAMARFGRGNANLRIGRTPCGWDFAPEFCTKNVLQNQCLADVAEVLSFAPGGLLLRSKSPVI
jgi:aminobenzoyl-glutamate utilization protein B